MLKSGNVPTPLKRLLSKLKKKESTFGNYFSIYLGCKAFYPEQPKAAHATRYEHYISNLLEIEFLEAPHIAKHQ